MARASFNPTTLTVGKTGDFDGHAATVVGRAVLTSRDQDRWDEYYVDLGGKKTCLLVYERGQWKRFDEFTPQKPFSVDEAQHACVGDFVHLTENAVRVGYVSRSTVVYGEGKLLEGERVGSEADYFNAVGDDGMVVVSWTGDEIEYYLGNNLSELEVRQAFSLPKSSFLRRFRANGIPKGVVVGLCYLGVLAAIIGFKVAGDAGRITSIDPPPVQAAPDHRLSVGSRGTIDGTRYEIAGHWVEEIDELGKRFKRDEYDLDDEQGGRALLVQSLTGNEHEWCLFRQTLAPPELTPVAAAKLKSGASLPLGGKTLLVQDLFRSQTKDEDGRTAGERVMGRVRYGWLAHAPGYWVIARWNASAVELEAGAPVPEATVLTEFGPVVQR